MGRTPSKYGSAMGADRAFCEGKIANARFFAAAVLPMLSLVRRQVEASDLSIAGLTEVAF